MSLASQIGQLDRTLATYKPDAPVEWQVGKIVNAMIAQAKEQITDSPVLDSIELFEPGPNDRWIANAHAGGVRAVLGQLQDLFPRDILIA
jgi:hypothetical protein